MKTIWHNFTNRLQALRLDSWLQLTPSNEWRDERVFAGLILFCLIAAVATTFLRIHPGLKQRFSQFFWFNAILGGCIFFFRWQRIPLLGMDLWRVFQALEALFWLISIGTYWRRVHPQVILQEKVNTYKTKYLPQNQKR